jgi:hypothetical protein
MSGRDTSVANCGRRSRMVGEVLLSDVRIASLALSELCGFCHRYPGFRQASTPGLSPVPLRGK